MKQVLIIFLFLLTACAAKKQAAEYEVQPEWLKKKPVIPEYYIGIGSSKKTGTFQEYSNLAKKDALADLAQEISVNISTTSVLHTIENKQGYIETFDQTINVSTEDYLEGFEPVDVYETENTYWVYFRINKNTYREKKNEKKQEALLSAKGKYISGLASQEQNNPKDALTFYLQGLQAIEAYLAEETTVDLTNKEIDIGNVLYSSLNDLVNSLEIKVDLDQISIKRGEPFARPIKFTILYNNSPVPGVPVHFEYSGGYLKKDKGISNSEGIIDLLPDPIQSKKEQENISASINLDKITNQAVENLFIRSLVHDKAIQAAIVWIDIEPLILSLNILDEDCGNMSCEKIIHSFQQNAIQKAYSIGTKNNADFKFVLNFNIIKGESAGGYTSAYIKGSLSISDKNNKKVWVKDFRDLKGTGNNVNEARQNVFNAFSSDLNRIYFKQGLDAIKQL